MLSWYRHAIELKVPELVMETGVPVLSWNVVSFALSTPPQTYTAAPEFESQYSKMQSVRRRTPVELRKMDPP